MLGSIRTNSSEKEKVAIVGLGYVGLPLALNFVNQGFHLIGIDSNSWKISQLRRCASYLSDVKDVEIRRAIQTGLFHITENYELIEEAEAIIICVPTPLTPDRSPDLSYLMSVGEAIRPHLKKRPVIILESSSYPGTTRDLLLPILERGGLKVGVDFFLGYSPERLDPGNTLFPVNRIPKVTSGITEMCASRVNSLYRQVFTQVVPVSSTEVAELTKILENSYRFINISFMNEMAILCDQMNIDIWEVVEAAKTKPFGYSPFYPGPGIGGHCIPVDPMYLEWKMQQLQSESSYITLSKNINNKMPAYVAERVKLLVEQIKSMTEAQILIYGVAYKRDVNDPRESSALEIIKHLIRDGAQVYYHDPKVPSIEVDDRLMHSVELTDSIIQNSDCVVLLIDHSEAPLSRLVEHAHLIFDTRNMTKGYSGLAKIYRLGAGFS
jgi:UDP-N-acetyl-D-glucosamine dehydrogenase